MVARKVLRGGGSCVITENRGPEILYYCRKHKIKAFLLICEIRDGQICVATLEDGVIDYMLLQELMMRNQTPSERDKDYFRQYTDFMLVTAGNKGKK